MIAHSNTSFRRSCLRATALLAAVVPGLLLADAAPVLAGQTQADELHRAVKRYRAATTCHGKTSCHVTFDNTPYGKKRLEKRSLSCMADVQDGTIRGGWFSVSEQVYEHLESSLHSTINGKRSYSLNSAAIYRTEPNCQMKVSVSASGSITLMECIVMGEIVTYQ